MNDIRRVVVGSPVHQKPAILREFMNALSQQDVEGLQVDHVFVDDNRDPASSALLREFADAVPRVTVVPVSAPDAYVCDEVTHHWTESLIWKVAEFKDAIIEHALEQGHDSLFLIDSDLVLHPRTLRHLVSRDCDVVSEVFWTRWQPDAVELPQVWVQDTYDLVPKGRGEELSLEETQRRINLVLGQLRTPGLYKVGGLGACTMISRRALELGARFREIPNLSFWGEDRHFCIRAAALGLELYADTELPPLHLYRDEDLSRVASFAAVSGLQLGALDQLATVSTGR
jgi:GT2 family glycosyltransferase